MKKIDLAIQKLAKPQHGVVSWFQLRRLRVTRAQVRSRVRSGEWSRELPGVWRLTWADSTWMQKAWSASLWGGEDAFISHRAAACLWELDGIEPDGVDLSAPRQLRRSAPWFRPHETAPIWKTMQRRRNGLPLTSPPRTLVDLAAVVDDEALNRALEDAFRRKLASPGEVRRVLRWMPPRGRAGTGRTARLLERGTWSAEAQSVLERRALELFRRFRLPEPECQYMVFEEDEMLGVVDFAWPSPKVIVEAEGFKFHSGRDAWESDAGRYNALVTHGWRVLRLTQADLRSRAEEFVQGLRSALARRR